MNIKKAATYFLLIISSFSLISCEGVTYFERIIENQSTTIINVQAQLDGGSNINFTLNPNSSESLFISENLGGSSFPINASSGISSLIITNANNDTILKDYTIENNWIAFIEETKKIPSQYDHTYTLIVRDDDF